ncbi:MAG: hypothetical protein QXP72_02750 [Desulfurococcaceae archaeon]
MFRTVFKGLSSYPVFLLTIVSILSISVIALRTIEAANEFNLARNKGTWSFSPRVNYVQIGDRVFIDIPKGVFNKVYEIILFQNNSSFIRELPYNNGLYGPITLHINASSIYIIGVVFKNNVVEPYLIDILVIEEKTGSINYVSKTTYPPALRIVTSDEFSIDSVQYLYGFNKFYELIPVTTFRTDVLENGYFYELREKDLLKHNFSPRPVHIFSGLLDASIVNITSRLRGLVDTYGSISEYALFNLTSRFAGTVTRQPVRIIFDARIAYDRVELTIPVKIAANMVVNDSLMDIALRHVFNISVKDIYGNEYSSYVTAIFTLRFTNRGAYRDFYLGNASVVNPRTPYSVCLNSTIVVDSGVYDIYLLVNYWIQVINPPPELPIYPYFFVIQGDQFTHGGFDNNVFAKIHVIDKLKIILDNETLLYYPISNHTLIRVSINGSLHSGYIVSVENRSFVTNNLIIEFSGKYVYVEDYAIPTLSLRIPIYVDTEVLEEVMFYIVNDTFNDSLLICFYTLNSLVRVRFVFKPVVISDSQYIIISCDTCRVYLLNLTIGLKLYVMRNDSSIQVDLPVNTRFYNFVVVHSVVFDEPLLIVENKIPNYSISVRIVFYNSTQLEYITTEYSVFELPYEPVVSLEVLVEPINLSTNVYVVSSLRTAREVILFVDNYIGLIKDVTVFKLPDRFVNKAIMVDGLIVLYE